MNDTKMKLIVVLYLPVTITWGAFVLMTDAMYYAYKRARCRA